MRGARRLIVVVVEEMSRAHFLTALISLNFWRAAIECDPLSIEYAPTICGMYLCTISRKKYIMIVIESVVCIATYYIIYCDVKAQNRQYDSNDSL